MAQRLDLARTRTLGQILSDTFELYQRHFLLFFVPALLIAFPANLATTLLIPATATQGKMTADDVDGALLFGIGAVVVAAILVTLLASAFATHAVWRLGFGETPTMNAVLGLATASLGALLPPFGLMLLAVVGVAVAAAAVIGIGAALFGPAAILALPVVLFAVYLGITWTLLSQAVIVDGARKRLALRRSAELVKGSWWWVFAVVIVAELIAAIPAGMIGAIGDATLGRTAGGIVFGTLGQALTLAIPGIAMTLLFFSLRYQKGTRVGSPSSKAEPAASDPE